MSFADLLKNVGREGFGVVRPTYVPERKRQEHAPRWLQSPEVVEEEVVTPDAVAFEREEVVPDEDNILAQTMRQIAEIQNKKYGQGRGGFKDIAVGGLLGALENLGKSDPRDGIAGMLGSAAGGALGLGVSSAIDRSADNRFRDQKKLRVLYGDAAVQSKLANEARQRKNIDADNEYNKSVLEDRRLAREERLAGQALTKIFGGKWFDPANPTHKALARTAKLDPSQLTGWDDRKPELKQVAGITYQRNKTTGGFEPTDLPVDEAKTLTEYKVTMPDGEVRSYKVAQKDAANFSTQMSALGARLNESARQFDAKLRLSTEQFNESKRQFKITSDQRAEAMRNLEAARAKGDEMAVKRYELDLQQHEARLQQLQQYLYTHKNDMDPNQFNELDSFFKKDVGLGSGAFINK